MRTALASCCAPSFKDSRAASSKSSSLGMVYASNGSELLLFAVRQDGEDVLLAEDQVLDLVELDLVAGVLRVDDGVSDGDVDRLALARCLVQPAVADSLDDPLLGLLLDGVGQ